MSGLVWVAALSILLLRAMMRPLFCGQSLFQPCLAIMKSLARISCWGGVLNSGKDWTIKLLNLPSPLDLTLISKPCKAYSSQKPQAFPDFRAAASGAIHLSGWAGRNSHSHRRGLKCTSRQQGTEHRGRGLLHWGENLLVLGSVPEGATEVVTYWPISVLFPLVFTASLDVDALMLSHLWKQC